ncbi:MAG TPA: cytochrome c3 family protein [Pyrinomonadaceae bacterium]
MKRHTIRSFAIALAMLLLALSQPSGDSAAGQRRRPPRRPPTQARRTTTVDYTRFSHSTKQHQEACKTCHKAPTINWQKVRDFPDVADYPDHDACVRCHRQQFFRGTQPAICTVCHTKVSPRDAARFPFRNPSRPEQFNVEFPHDKHQDVIASLRQRPAFGERARTLFVKSAHAVVEDKSYNNCTICHGPNTKEVAAPPGGWIDGFSPRPETFKAVPDSHAACFNCHWKSQEPVKDNCAGCHQPAAAPYLPVTAPKRISIKFSHEGGGEKKNHVAECTTCHINITRAATLRGLKPDVPITGCTECHNKEGLRQDLSKELAAIDRDRSFVCSYCHTSNVGKLDPPASHYIIAERQPLKRSDLK